MHASRTTGGKRHGATLTVAGMAIGLLALSACSSVSASPDTSGHATAQGSATAGTDAAVGEPVTADGVTVTGAAGSEPTITIEPGAQPPAKLVVTELTPGTGAEVKPGDTVTANYVGVTWSTGQVFDSSWTGGQPITFPLAEVIPGWQQGLVGQKVGGRTLLIIPPDMGYGAMDMGTIPANSTLVFVVDLTAVNGA